MFRNHLFLSDFLSRHNSLKVVKFHIWVYHEAGGWHIQRFEL